jgi:DNA-binding MarR family transcriptional regulator
MKTPRITLNNEDAIVLQQISELGEEDVIGLQQSLGMNRGRVLASIESLRRKGLITVHRISDDWWFHLSRKGKQLTQYMWPEMAPVKAGTYF